MVPHCFGVQSQNIKNCPFTYELFCNMVYVLNKSKVNKVINIPRSILYYYSISKQLYTQTDLSSGLVSFGLFDLGVWIWKEQQPAPIISNHFQE